jgi:hypothetical protein
MICSALNRLRFIRPSPLRRSDSTQIWRNFWGSGQLAHIALSMR